MFPVTSTPFQNADQAQHILGINATALLVLISTGKLTAYDTGKFENPGQLQNYRFKPADLQTCKEVLHG